MPYLVPNIDISLRIYQQLRKWHIVRLNRAHERGNSLLQQKANPRENVTAEMAFCSFFYYLVHGI
jgi:hypothetical protein